MTRQKDFRVLSLIVSVLIPVLCFLTALISLNQNIAMASDYVCKIASGAPPALSGIHAGVFFAEELKKRSKGEIESQEYYRGKLGATAELMNKIEMGSIQFMNTGGMMLSRWTNKADVLMLPFVFDDWDKVDRFSASNLLEPLKKDLEKKGVMLVGLAAYGMLDIAARSKIKRLEDMKGLKFRIQPTPIFRDMCKYLGVNGMPIPYPELYSSLKQGIVDGVFNSSEAMILDKTSEVCKYVTNTNHMCGFIVQILNKKWYDGLPNHLKKAVMDSIDIACKKERQRVRIREEEFTKKMRDDKGVTFIDLSSDEKKRFVNALMPLHSDFEKIIGKEYMQRLYKLTDFR